MTRKFKIKSPHIPAGDPALNLGVVFGQRVRFVDLLAIGRYMTIYRHIPGKNNEDAKVSDGAGQPTYRYEI